MPLHCYTLYSIMFFLAKYPHFRFSASDGKGGVAAADVTVNLCNCSGHGECLFDLLADGYELKQTFRIVQCNCSTGWEGKTYEVDNKYSRQTNEYGTVFQYRMPMITL